MKIKTKSIISRVESMSYRAQRSSLVLSFERFSISATSYPLLNKREKLLGSTATVAVQLKTEDRTEIIHIETKITDVDMGYFISDDDDDDDDDDEEYLYSIKLKDASIHTGDKYISDDDLLGQVVYVKLNLKQKEEN